MSGQSPSKILIAAPGYQEPGYLGRVSAYNATASERWFELKKLEDALVPLQRLVMGDEQSLIPLLEQGFHRGPIATSIRWMAGLDQGPLYDDDVLEEIEAPEPWRPDEVWMLYRSDFETSEIDVEGFKTLQTFGGMSKRMSLAQSYMSHLVGFEVKVRPIDVPMEMSRWEPCFREIAKHLAPLLADIDFKPFARTEVGSDDLPLDGFSDLFDEIDSDAYALKDSAGHIIKEHRHKSHEFEVDDVLGSLRELDVRILVGSGMTSVRVSLIFLYLILAGNGSELWYTVDQAALRNRFGGQSHPPGAVRANFGPDGLPEMLTLQDHLRIVAGLDGRWSAFEDGMWAKIRSLEGELTKHKLGGQDFPTQDEYEALKVGMLQGLVNELWQSDPNMPKMQFYAEVARRATALGWPYEAGTITEFFNRKRRLFWPTANT